jgi:molybdate transport system substrate-binding protein
VSRRALVLALAVTLVAVACEGSASSDDDRELTVAAAASLTAAFTQIGADFQEETGVAVVFTFGPSDGLATQIVEGAPVDVFASASPAWMDEISERGPGVRRRTNIARNRLAVIVPTENPAIIHELDDLATEGVQLVLAAEGVPAGDYAREILANAGIADAALANVVSNEEDVAGVVTKVLTGEADAGIAYVTDVTAEVASRISVVEIPDDVNVIATYPIAVIADSGRPDDAREFVEFVLGPGQGALADHGFLPVE